MPPEKEKQKNVTYPDHSDQRNFAYTRNGVQLKFSLRTDIKQDLKDFLEVLQTAVTDVKATLDKVGQ